MERVGVAIVLWLIYMERLDVAIVLWLLYMKTVVTELL
jgi:hypothetical protein